MIPFTNKELELYASPENCHICKEKFKKNAQIFKKYHKFGDQWHYFVKSRDTAHNIYILKQSLLKEITIVSYGSHNDYHFIITALAEGFRGQFTKYKNTNKYQKRKKNDKKNINLSVQMKQEN